MKGIATTLLLAAMLAVPAQAAAKGTIDGLKVCGAGGCSDVAFRPSDASILTRLRPATAPPPAGTFHELRMLSRGNASTVFILPERGLLGVLTTEGDWFRLPPGLARRVRDAAAGLEPFSFTLSEVTVDGRSAPEPSDYLALLSQRPGTIPAEEAYPHIERWVSIDLESDRPSPWTWGTVTFRYDPALRAVAAARSFTWKRIPEALAERIERDAGIAAPVSARSEERVPWTWALIAVAGLGSAAVLASARRQHRAQQPRPQG